ncbi:MAG TPA: DNA polymerase ligase N-terminal domain-containing protein, partial [Rhizobacter sp.]|nr:DNA polymerase ligase N-terminal domain-containing protein [Rhizobacter sp.]
MATREALAAYHRKRNFSKTPEPHQAGKHSAGRLSFVIQKHHASQLHYDFRLELDGTLKSWAVPKGPCLDPGVKRMAVHVEDHPLSYADFEGSIPEGNYGAGDVIVWDRGEWLPDEDAHKGYASGKLKFELKGQKLHGHWALVRMRGKGEKQEPWLLIKDTDSAARPLDEYDVLAQEPSSVISGRDVAPDAQQAAKAPARKPAAKRAASAKRTSASKPARLPRITHAERVIDKSSGITKGDLVAYYQSVADLMLVHLHQRPVSLVRAPEGVGGELFFQKHAQGRELPHVTLLDPSLDPEHAPLLQIDSTAALLSAAQMNTIELHTWNATSKIIDKPDRMTFDLDPGEGVPWDRMQDAALLVQTLLVELGMTPFLKTSGGKGLHVVVP